MSDEIPIDEITKNIIEQIQNEDKISTGNEAQEIDNSEDSNFKNYLKEALLLFLLFIILNHTSCNNLLDSIPFEIINDNNILQLVIKAIIMIIFFYFFKFLLN